MMSPFRAIANSLRKLPCSRLTLSLGGGAFISLLAETQTHPHFRL